MAKPPLIHGHLTGSHSEDHGFVAGTETVVSSRQSAVPAVPGTRRQMFNHHRLNRLVAT